MFPRALLALLPALLAPTLAAQVWPDQPLLERLLGKKALRLEDEQVLHFYGWRKGIAIAWQQRPVEIFEGIVLRTSFQRRGDECLCSGNWLLFGDETGPVAAALAAGNLRIASLLPRFPGATPQTFELRFFGEGGEAELATPVARAQELLQALREAKPQPESSVPGRRAAGPSHVVERPLEDCFGSKAEVKEGVPLFRFAGPRGLHGTKAGTRMGLAVTVAFTGDEAASEARLDWCIDRRELPRLLTGLGAEGFWLESLVPAAPAVDAELLQLSLVGRGPALALAKAVQAQLADRSRDAGLADGGAFTPPTAPEVLGLAGGKLADGWRSDATLPAGERRATWAVEAAAERVARMTDPGAWNDRTFNLLWTDRIRFQDGKLTLRLRADQGRVDQGGGLVWRVQDADNYYVTRFNPLEQDFRVYRVKHGVREQLQALGELPYRSQDWFTIEVEQQGDVIVCRLNGRETLQVKDATFAGAGGVGIWSKADSQCSAGGLWVARRPDDAAGR